MKSMMFLMAAAGMGAMGFSQTASSAPERCLRVQTSFDLVVHASYAETAPLFGPEGERAWAGEHWDPQFIYPQPVHDQEGAVFTVRHGTMNAVWVTTLFDVDGRHLQYVYFLPDLMVTTIDVRFKPVGAAMTEVSVVYSRTALAPAGNEQVAAMSEVDKNAGKDWQQRIGDYLAGRKN